MVTICRCLTKGNSVNWARVSKWNPCSPTSTSTRISKVTHTRTKEKRKAHQLTDTWTKLTSPLVARTTHHQAGQNLWKLWRSFSQDFTNLCCPWGPARVSRESRARRSNRYTLRMSPSCRVTHVIPPRLHIPLNCLPMFTHLTHAIMFRDICWKHMLKHLAVADFTVPPLLAEFQFRTGTHIKSQSFIFTEVAFETSCFLATKKTILIRATRFHIRGHNSSCCLHFRVCLNR